MNRRHRLGGRGRFSALRAHGVDVRRSGLRLRAVGNGLAVSRAAFAVVGARSSVRRNRLRRRLRAAARPIVEAHPGLDVLASVGAAWEERSFLDLGRELALAWASAERQVLDAAVPSLLR